MSSDFWEHEEKHRFDDEVQLAREEEREEARRDSMPQFGPAYGFSPDEPHVVRTLPVTPCRPDCSFHEGCLRMRAGAAASCSICGREMGYADAVTEYDGSDFDPGVVSHAGCWDARGGR